MRTLTAIVMSLLAGGTSEGATFAVGFDRPCLDRWNYPFNTEPGYRSATSVFSALGQENSFPGFSFDQRDSQSLIGFDTGLAATGGCPGVQVTPGLGECAYSVTSAVMTIAVSTDQAFPYDPTYDAWTTYPTAANPGNIDLDPPGRPVELYGAGFRAPWTAANYFEGTALNPAPDFGPSVNSDVRNVYATDAHDGGVRDVSNNVRDGFDPTVFAVGTNASLTPGQFVPANTDMTFTLNVANADVQRYLRRSLNGGRVFLMLTSLQPATSAGGPGAGQYATFYTKENLFGAGRAARLVMSVSVRTKAGDANFDDIVNGADLSVLLSQFGGSVALPGDGADFNCDGLVNGADLSVLLSNFGS